MPIGGKTEKLFFDNVAMECCSLSKNHALIRDEGIGDYDSGAILFSLFNEVRMRRALLITARAYCVAGLGAKVKWPSAMTFATCREAMPLGRYKFNN